MPNLYGNIRVFSGSAHGDLAARIAARLGLKVRLLFLCCWSLVSSRYLCCGTGGQLGKKVLNSECEGKLYDDRRGSDLACYPVPGHVSSSAPRQK
jgi:hypothetical protein